IPEITVAVEQSDVQRALATLDKLAAKLAAILGSSGGVQTQQVGGVTAKRIDLGRFAVYYAAVGDKLVVTDSPTGITGLQAAGQSLPPEVTGNLAPLYSLLLYGTTDGDVATIKGFLEVK